MLRTLTSIFLPALFVQRKRQIQRILLTIAILFISLPVLAERIKVINTKPPIDKTQTLVFFPDGEMLPPYEVTGEVIGGRATIFINGIQVEPNPKNEKFRLKCMGPPTRYDICRNEFAPLACELEAAGYSQDEIDSEMDSHILECVGVVDVDRSKGYRIVTYEDGEICDSWKSVTWYGCDMQKTADWKAKRFQKGLNNGDAFLFTETCGDIRVNPRRYKGFIEELSIARDSSKTIEDYEWDCLDSTVVYSIRQSLREK